MLEKAIQIAVNAHLGQVDKSGQPYILHPLRVMLMGKDEDEMIVGVLHDVVEDTYLTPERLRKLGVPSYLVDAIVAMSRHFYGKETYKEFIERIAQNDLARRVKLHDIADNTAPWRIATLPEAERDIVKRYEKAKAYLESR